MGRKPLANTVKMVVIVLTALAVACAIAACGGGEQADPNKADIGKTVVIDPWQITLNGVPQTMNVAGEGGITYASQNGTFVIVPVTVANKGSEITLIPHGFGFLAGWTRPQIPCRRLFTPVRVPAGAQRSGYLD